MDNIDDFEENRNIVTRDLMIVSALDNKDSDCKVLPLYNQWGEIVKYDKKALKNNTRIRYYEFITEDGELIREPRGKHNKVSDAMTLLYKQAYLKGHTKYEKKYNKSSKTVPLT